MQRLNFCKYNFRDKRPSPPRLFIFDFDGTLTDVDKESVPFVRGYKKSLAKILGNDIQNVETLWDRHAAEIERNPHLHGWWHNGRIVASASADPLIMCRCIGDMILTNERLVPNAARRSEVLDSCFHENYGKLGIIFKSGIVHFLDYICRIAPVVVVTNSPADKAMAKLRRLDDEQSCHHSDIPIYGDARKYRLDDMLVEVPECESITGLARPVYLRRGAYARRLQDILSHFRLAATEAIVFGDIYELDLALPAALGIPIVLVPRPQTPDYEERWVMSRPTGFVLNGLNLIG